MNRKGFTLIELVTAVGIFSILGVMLFSMVRTGMAMWKQGEVSRNEMSRGVVVLETIARELRLAFTENDPLAGAPRARFIADFFDYDRNGDGLTEARVQRLRFVRINTEERENELLRKAGDTPFGSDYFTLLEEPKLDEALPTEGLAEVVFMSYAPSLPKGKRSAGVLDLYRGYRSPPGGPFSFFDAGSLRTPRDIERDLSPVLDGILHLEFRFWNQFTRTFDPELARPDTPEGAGYTWDSTRELLSNETTAWPNRFRFAREASALPDVTDEIFPARVLITVVVEDPLGSDMVARTTGPLRKEEKRIPVDIVKPFKNPVGEGRFVRIGEEWIEISGLDGSELVVTRRGVRHTVPSEHPVESLVHKGRRFSMVVEIPGVKDCWNDVER